MYKEESFPTQSIPPNNAGVTPWGVFTAKKAEGNPISAQIVEDIRKDRGLADSAVNNVIEGKRDESINRGYQLFNESIQRDRGPIEQKEEGRDISGSSMGESSWRNDSSGKGSMNYNMGESSWRNDSSGRGSMNSNMGESSLKRNEGLRGSDQSSNIDESIRRDRGPTEHKVEGRDMGESSFKRNDSSNSKGGMNSNMGESSFKRNDSSNSQGGMNSNMGESSFKRNERSSGNQSSNMDESIRRDRGPTEHKVKGRDT